MTIYYLVSFLEPFFLDFLICSPQIRSQSTQKKSLKSNKEKFKAQKAEPNIKQHTCGQIFSGPEKKYQQSQNPHDDLEGKEHLFLESRLFFLGSALHASYSSICISQILVAGEHIDILSRSSVEI